jgi:hypothetical protein
MTDDDFDDQAHIRQITLTIALIGPAKPVRLSEFLEVIDRQILDQIGRGIWDGRVNILTADEDAEATASALWGCSISEEDRVE